MVHTDINDNEKKDYTELNNKINNSNKKLTQINQSLYDLEYLGWEVPSECPIQNTYSNGVFTQRVGRVDLGSLTWTYASGGMFYYAEPPANAKLYPTNKVGNIVCARYITDTYTNATIQNGHIGIAEGYGNGRIVIKDTSYTDTTAFKNSLQGLYLYYELTAPITIKDGHEVVTEIKNDLSPHTITGTTDTNGNMNLDLLPTNVDLISVVGSGVIVVPFVYDEQYIVKALDVNSFLEVTETEITLNAYYKNK